MAQAKSPAFHRNGYVSRNTEQKILTTVTLIGEANVMK
jgi:hypothetical protein